MQGPLANASHARARRTGCAPANHPTATLLQRWSLLSEQRRLRRRPSLSLSASAPAAAAADAPAPQQHPLVSLVLSHAGGAVDGVRPVAGTDQGWGLEADRDLPRGHRAVVLPASCHLTFESTAARCSRGGGGGSGGGMAGGSDADADGASAAAAALASLSDDIPPELWGARLALALLRERALGPGEASPFSAYVAALPAALPGVPLFFGAEAVDALDYPPVSEQVKKRCRWLHGFAARHAGTRAAEAAFAGAHVDVGALGWALAAVTSRAFRVGGPGRPAALLPLVDLCNHSFEPNAEVVPYIGPGSGSGATGGPAGETGGKGGGKGGVAVVTKRALKKGEPVLLSYGPLPNDFLLLDYGFVVANNPHDVVCLRFDPQGLLSAGAAAAGVLREQAGLAPLPGSGGRPELLDFSEELERSSYKRRRLAALGLLPDAADNGGTDKGGASLEVAIGAGRAGGAPVADPRLLAAARLLASRSAAETDGLPDRELGAWSRSADASAGAVCPLGNRAGEVAALRALAGAAGVALSRFRSTLEEDEAAAAALLLEPPPAPAAAGAGAGGAAAVGGSSSSSGSGSRGDLLLAVRLRAEKKRVLLRAVEALGARVAAVRGRRDIPALPAGATAAGGGGGGPAAPGQKPRPATDRGFGASAGAGGGGAKKKR